jgi:hypothetical protein
MSTEPDDTDLTEEDIDHMMTRSTPVEICELPHMTVPEENECERRHLRGDTPGGYGGISIAGRWECGSCGASGDAWWTKEDGPTLMTEDGDIISIDDHECEEE